MRLTVRFQNGARADALLLATSGSRLRVIVKGRGLTEEWLVFDGHCFDERGQLLEIEFVSAVESARPGTLTAGMSN